MRRKGRRRGGVGEEEGWEKGEEYLLFAVRYTRRTTTSHTISKVCDLRGKEEKGKREGALKEKEEEERGKREGREREREAVIL